MKLNLTLPVLFVLILSACSFTAKLRESRDWKKDSQKIARDFAGSLGKLYPEYVANYGFSKFNSRTTSFSKDLENQTYAHAYHWKNKLERILDVEKNRDLKTDVRILIDFQNLEMEKIELDRKLGVVPFLAVTEYVLENLRSLMRKDSTKLELNAGMARFRAYVRGEQNKLPLVDGFTAHMLNRMNHLAENRMRGIWPVKSEIENYLQNCDELFKELYSVLSLTPNHEWKRDFEELKLQESNYRLFLRKKVLPYARTKMATHPALYNYYLKQSGIFTSPQELINLGEADYQLTYKEFTTLAKKIALKYKLSDSTPPSVIEHFKSKKITSKDDILSSFRSETDNLMNIVLKHDLLSIKKKPDFEIRFAYKSEMSSMASPHFIPAALVGKTKVPSQFVIPLLTGIGGTDDYIYPESIVHLVAHEAIPGHAIQFEVQKERGTTLIRSWFAMNSVNVEGWALYAESIIYPYLDDDLKFVFLQRRLWRIARTFLDPQLNLGIIKAQRIKEIFVNELGFSESLAETEFKRYNYIMPGQAPSYYYGMKSLLETKKQVKEKLKKSFNEKCFNDAVLDSGPIPLSEINSRLVKGFNCDP